MAAYAALVTLSKAINQILPYEQHYSFLCDTQKMQSLLHKVIRFQGFLEGISGKSSDGIDELESRIRDVAHRLEDIVESILVYSLAMEYENEVNPRLSIQGADTQFTVGAESRDVSRKFRKVRKTVKNSSAEASIGVTAEDLSKLKITLYGRESLSTLSPGATDTKVVLEDDVNQTTGHETVPSTSAESETSLDRKVVSGSLSVLSPGATDTKVVLEDDINQTTRHMEYGNEVNSRLSIQGAEGRDVSRKFRKFKKTVKDGSDEAHHSVREEDLSEMKKTLDGKGSLSILTPGDVNQTAGHESTLPATSAKSETETSLDNILGWCLDDQDLEDKAKYSHFPLTERVAAAFGNCIEEADLLLEEATEMKKNLDNRVVISGTSIAMTSLSGGAPDTNNTTVGLKDVLNQILDQIRSEQRALEVIPITGMGGIGKTTLARAVYDHHGKQDHFDLVLWATVSQQYNVKEILQVLCPEAAESDEVLNVHQRLHGRRYLIILDDVWDEKVWDGVRNAFPNNNNRSRVILTTRLSNIATYVIGSSSTHDAHQMQLLNGEQSWDLLRKTVYGHEIGCLSNFEYYIGRRISRNCKGLPLALVVIGGLLKLNNTKDHWEHVAASTTAEAAADDDSMLRILSLSYRNLPPHLKACFLYFGMFPEDEEIPTKELVRLWCAEGFLKPKESKTMEEVAEECLEELVARNLILVNKNRYNGKIKTSIIHDVLRDLSLIQAQKEKFLYCHNGSSKMDGDTFRRIIKDQPRRVSFPYLDCDWSISYNSPVRTIFQTQWYDELSPIILGFKLVRVLRRVPFSSSALKLNNLRYLHLHKKRGDEPIMVPKSISKLRNLETLFLSGRYFSGELILPVEIWEMPRLRHLVSEGVNIQLAPFPASDDSSRESLSLQTVTGLLNFGDFSPRLIQKLQQNLKKLQISYDQNSWDDEDKVFGLENLVNLHHLEHLTIWSSEDDFTPALRNIGFPCNLKKLSLTSTYLPWEKMTLIGELNHLEVLKLEYNAFVGGEVSEEIGEEEVWEPIEGGFPQLKYLKMEELCSLEEWRAESTHFPSLEKLVILECMRLKEVPAEIGDIDTLEKLIVKKHWTNGSVGDCFEKSVRMIEEEQQRVGNHSLKVIFC